MPRVSTMLDMTTVLPLLALACNPTITAVSPHSSPPWVQISNDCDETIDTSAVTLRFGTHKWTESVELPDGFIHPGQCFDAAAQMMPTLGHCWVGVALFDFFADVLTDQPLDAVGIGLKWATSCGIEVDTLGIAPFGFMSVRKADVWYRQPMSPPPLCKRPPLECLEILGFAPGEMPWVQVRNTCDYDLDMAQFALGYGSGSLFDGVFLSDELLAPDDCLVMEQFEGDAPATTGSCAISLYATTVQGGVGDFVLAGESTCPGDMPAKPNADAIGEAEAVYRGWPSWSWQVADDKGPALCESPWITELNWKA